MTQRWTLYVQPMTNWILFCFNNISRRGCLPYDFLIDYDLAYKIVKKINMYDSSEFEFVNFVATLEFDYCFFEVEEVVSYKNLVEDYERPYDYLKISSFRNSNLKINLMKSIIFNRVCDVKFYFF